MRQNSFHGIAVVYGAPVLTHMLPFLLWTTHIQLTHNVLIVCVRLSVCFISKTDERIVVRLDTGCQVN